jgi:hypothetical protein
MKLNLYFIRILSSSYEFQKLELDLNLFELIKSKRMENWQSALCTRAETGQPISSEPNHLGWWTNYKENKGGREDSPMAAGRWCG